MKKRKLVQVENARSLSGKKDGFLLLYRRCLGLALKDSERSTAGKKKT